MKHLIITLSSSADKQSLQALACAAGATKNDFVNLSLVLNVPADCSAHVIDDLVSFNDVAMQQTITHHIECNIQTNAALTLISKLIPFDLIEKKADTLEALSDDAIISKKITLTLAGIGSSANVLCTALNGGKRQIKYVTMQNHVVGESKSNVLIKGIMNDASRLSCNSMIKVAKDAHKTHAEQANKNILLSPQARAVSIPQLEIEANDVICKHGAAVSKFDAEQLFYMQSRGIQPTQAYTMLIAGFLEA